MKINLTKKDITEIINELDLTIDGYEELAEETESDYSKQIFKFTKLKNKFEKVLYKTKKNE